MSHRRRLGSWRALAVIGAAAWMTMALAGDSASVAKEKPADDSAAAKIATKVVSGDKHIDGAAQLQQGRELFSREWVANDPRSVAGDGLGPMYNESSCVACHNQGGAGGAGPVSRNVDILTAFFVDQQQFGQRAFQPRTLPEAIVDSLFGGLVRPAPQQAPAPEKPDAETLARLAKEKKERKARLKKELVSIHPGFAGTRSVVLHRFSTDPEYGQWRQRASFGQFGVMFDVQTSNELVLTARTPAVAAIAASPDAAEQIVEVQATQAVRQPPQPVVARTTRFAGQALMQIQQLQQETQMGRNPNMIGAMQHGNFTLLRSQRNPSPLFGAGLIDAVSEKALQEAAARKHEGFPEVTGRVAKLKDGKTGRFGWKSQIASLEDFTLTACAVELGLDVPSHPQAGSVRNPKYVPQGNDMSAEQATALVSFIRELAAPGQIGTEDKKNALFLQGGQKLFTAVGCATCHTQEIGEARGIYSDLLLHDMGPELGDAGSSYGTFVPNQSEEDDDFEPTPLAEAHGHPTGPGGLVDPTKEIDPKTGKPREIVGALRQEWRTAPLWGLRDSAPYLHDGRADSIEQAIALHGGEAQNIRQQFFQLKPREQQQLVSFLKSLVAPDQLARGGK